MSFFIFHLAEADYRVEGFSDFYDYDKRLFLMSTFLPYNPNILALSPQPEIYKACSQFWRKGSFFYDSDPDLTYDLLWLQQEDGELETLAKKPYLLTKASLIYTSTHLQENGIYFRRLKSFLEISGFTFLTHWYWENQKGNALFIKRGIYDAAMRSLVYNPSFTPSLPPPIPCADLQSFFRPALNKSNEHRWDGIDFIYMINLDERPEKFALSSSELQLYGINPYRFSAVNGWKLPTSTFSKLGVIFAPGTLQEPFLGSTYKQIDGEEFLHTEFLYENGTAYLSRGLARGPVGIVLSHLSILQDAYDSGHNTIWVMEDDVEVVGDPSQIPHLIQTLDELAPDWDIFFTDTDTKDTVGNHVTCRALAARPNVPVPPLATFLEKFYPVGKGLHRTGMRYGAYSMILRRSGVKKILDYYKTYRIFIPYDMDYWLAPDLKMFHYEKDIISHRAGAPSDNGTPGY